MSVEERIRGIRKEFDGSKYWMITKQEIGRELFNPNYTEWLESCLVTEREKVRQLSEALKGYYEHSKNNHQINGINETAKELLNIKEG